MNQELKDKITNICGVILAICGTIETLKTQGIVFPPIVGTIEIIAGTIAAGVVAYCTGKGVKA